MCSLLIPSLSSSYRGCCPVKVEGAGSVRWSPVSLRFCFSWVGATLDTLQLPPLQIPARGQPFGFSQWLTLSLSALLQASLHLVGPQGPLQPNTDFSSLLLPTSLQHTTYHLRSSLLLPAHASWFYMAGLCPCCCLHLEWPLCLAIISASGKLPLIAISSMLAFWIFQSEFIFFLLLNPQSTTILLF